MNAYQLDLFEPIPDEIDILRSQIIDLNNMSHSVRKGVFKKVSDLEKKLFVIEERLSLIEKVCNIKDHTYQSDKLTIDFLPKPTELVK